jgi:hypothetical protein
VRVYRCARFRVNSSGWHSGPLVSSRIRHFILDIENFDPFLSYEQALRKARNPSSLLDKLKALLGVARRLDQAQPVLISVEASLEKLDNLLSGMQGVVELHISLRHPPTTPALVNSFTAAWLVSGNNIHTLSLCMGIEGWKTFSKSEPSLPSLRTLGVELFAASAYEQFSPDLTTYFKTVAAFINLVSGHIKTLNLHSSFEPFTNTMLFPHLRPFPVLQSLSLCVPFNPDLKEAASTLKSFLLQCSSTLEKTYLRIAYPPSAPNRERVLAWLADLTSNPLCFAQIRSLDIRPANLNVLQQCISNSGGRLESLTLVNDLDFLSLETVLHLFTLLRVCQRLSFLRLEIGLFSPEIFDAFARDLPRLQYLWLTIQEYRLGLYKGRRQMITKEYPEWQLRDLTIWNWNYDLDADAMRVCSQAIPLLRSSGQGELDQTPF